MGQFIRSLIIICAFIPPSLGQMDPTTTLACWANATTCLYPLFTKLGFSNDVSASAEQMVNVSKGFLMRPWTETCTSDYGSTFSTSITCYQNDIYTCDQGLQAHAGISADTLLSSYRVFQYYCAPGCEQLQQISVKMYSCSAALTERLTQLQGMSAADRNATFTAANKTALCEQAKSTITCASQVTAGCQYAETYLEYSVNSTQAVLTTLGIPPQDCPLTVPATTAPPPGGRGARPESLVAMLLIGAIFLMIM